MKHFKLSALSLILLSLSHASFAVQCRELAEPASDKCKKLSKKIVTYCVSATCHSSNSAQQLRKKTRDTYNCLAARTALDELLHQAEDINYRRNDEAERNALNNFKKCYTIGQEQKLEQKLEIDNEIKQNSPMSADVLNQTLWIKIRGQQE